MKKILAVALFFISAGAVAQPSNPSIVVVSADPSGTTACNLPWQYNRVDGTAWYPANPSGGTCTWTQLGSGAGGSSQSCLVTDHGAACDGHTDDSAAIQACLNSGAQYTFLPMTTPTLLQQCNHASTLMIPPGVHLNGQGSILAYTGSTVGIDAYTVPTLSNQWKYLENITIDDTEATGTPKAIYATGTRLTEVTSQNIPAGGWALFNDQFGDMTLDNFYWSGSVYLDQTSLTATHMESFGCTNTTDTALTLGYSPTSIVSFYVLDYYDACAHAVHLLQGSTGFNAQLASFDLLSGAGPYIDNSADTATFTIQGTMTFFNSPTNVTLFSNPALYQGDASVQINGQPSGVLQNGGVFASGLSYPLPSVFSTTGIPTCVTGLANATAQVTDALLPTYLGTYSNGGAVHTEVLCNGTNWVTY